MNGSIWKHQNKAARNHDTTRGMVSLILRECPNTGGWSVGLLKGKRRRRGKMPGKEGKMSSSIKPPYVYSLSSIMAPGIRAGQACIWASQPVWSAAGLPLLSLPLFQGPFLLDTSADLLLKPAHLLLKFTDEIYHTLREQRAVETKDKR